jgi:hypothetical protein
MTTSPASQSMSSKVISTISLARTPSLAKMSMIVKLRCPVAVV